MSEPSSIRDFHRFVIGDLRVDGFKSPWRESTEADFAARGVSLESPPAPKRKIPTFVEIRLRKRLISGGVAQ